MQIKQDINLAPHNTFGIDCYANSFTEVTSDQELKEVFNTCPEKFLILGGGSNILFTEDFQGLIIHLNLKGIHSKKIDENYIEINAITRI